jgi:hypothetical protein
VFSEDFGYISLGLGSPIVEFDATAVPEPATTGLIGLGLAAFSFLGIRSRNKRRIV